MDISDGKNQNFRSGLDDNMTIFTGKNFSSIKNIYRSSNNESYLKTMILIIMIFYIIGVVGNFLALIILSKRKTPKNSKYTFMLRCLVTNNLVGLLGMQTQCMLKLILPSKILMSFVKWECIGRVLWRYFGLSSGCIAAVMAIERWMALVRPFHYHKHITYNVIKKTITYLLYVAAIITFLPFTGFGVFFDQENKKCLRYRDAETPADIAYAYLFMIFGTLLCIVIVGCNLFVTRVLCLVNNNKNKRRITEYDIVNGEKAPTSSFHHRNLPCASSDEIRFAKVMTFLSISFVICWMPQMISIPLALTPNVISKSHWFFKLADLLMAVHFTSDPYIYVLTRTKKPFNWNFLKNLSNRRGMIQRTQSDQSRSKPLIDHTIDYGLNTSS